MVRTGFNITAIIVKSNSRDTPQLISNVKKKKGKHVPCFSEETYLSKLKSYEVTVSRSHGCWLIMNYV